MADQTAKPGGPVLAADGTPLKRSLARALRREKMRAFLLVAPLLVFILITFVAPIADMLFRSVENNIVRDTIPRTVQALRTWDPEADELPPDSVFNAFYTDMVFAEERTLRHVAPHQCMKNQRIDDYRSDVTSVSISVSGTRNPPNGSKNENMKMS